jgi:hypothetical protein
MGPRVAFAAQAQRRFRTTNLFLALIAKYRALKAIAGKYLGILVFLAIFRFSSQRQIPAKANGEMLQGMIRRAFLQI